MNEIPETILDHIDNIIVPGKPFDEQKNEYEAMVSLYHGLECLNYQAGEMEKIVESSLDVEPNVKQFRFGSMPGLSRVQYSMLTCMFHWYAVSACNYARLVGAIAYRQDKNRPRPPEYIRSVMPEVLGFRDKIAAHFAWATENGKDNAAERRFSIFPQIAWNRDCLEVCAMSLKLSKGDKVTDSRSLKPWSITKIHKQLCERYWRSSEDADKVIRH